MTISSVCPVLDCSGRRSVTLVPVQFCGKFASTALSANANCTVDSYRKSPSPYCVPRGPENPPLTFNATKRFAWVTYYTHHWPSWQEKISYWPRKILKGGLTRISHQLTVEAHDRPAITSLRLLTVLNVGFKYARIVQETGR